MSERCDVVVAGLGAMGSAVLHELARAGIKATGIDRFAPPHDRGSSHGHVRLTREAYYEDPLYVPLVRRASTLFERLEVESGCGPVRIPTGAAMLGPAESEVIRGTLRSAADHGVPHDEMSGEEFGKRFPMFVPPPGVRAVYEPGAALLRPERIIAAQLELARRHGAEVRLGEPVGAWRQSADGVEVQVGATRILADQLVLSVGAWMPTLLGPEILPLVVERQVQHWWRPAHRPERFAAGVMPVTLFQQADGSIFYTMPDCGDGVKVAWHHGGNETTGDGVDRSVHAPEHAAIASLVSRYFADAGGASAGTAVCLYTNTRDGHFVVDRHPGASRVVVVSACSGHGFKFSSAIGEEVARLVTGAAAGFDLAPFRISRFEG